MNSFSRLCVNFPAFNEYCNEQFCNGIDIHPNVRNLLWYSIFRWFFFCWFENVYVTILCIKWRSATSFLFCMISEKEWHNNLDLAKIDHIGTRKWPNVQENNMNAYIKKPRKFKLHFLSRNNGRKCYFWMFWKSVTLRNIFWRRD